MHRMGSHLQLRPLYPSDSIGTGPRKSQNRFERCEEGRISLLLLRIEVLFYRHPVCSVFTILSGCPVFKTCMLLLIYFTSYVLNMFRTLICPSSGACDYSVELPHWSYFSVNTEDLALA